MRDNTGVWRAITLDEMQALIADELARCSTEDFDLFQKIKIEPKKIRFDRGAFAEDAFIVAQIGKKIIFFDDIEDGFEVGTPDDDGVLRFRGVGQFELGHALAQFRLRER